MRKLSGFEYFIWAIGLGLFIGFVAIVVLNSIPQPKPHAHLPYEDQGQLHFMTEGRYCILTRGLLGPAVARWPKDEQGLCPLAGHVR